ncbi:hypothetical protein QYE76_039422 [Lolium multiflorum]|uniref:Uncharacterized protein n=1 Tax=Lolium multiflorum TaxID=4521 RepID=A0AAD8WS56_LOLMU|nr:hypothetical protein QYE76_039422 [Lolium multiflorum]
MEASCATRLVWRYAAGRAWRGARRREGIVHVKRRPRCDAATTRRWRCDAAKADNGGGGELHSMWRSTTRGGGCWRCDAASSWLRCDAAKRRRRCDAATRQRWCDTTGAGVMPSRSWRVGVEPMQCEAA